MSLSSFASVRKYAWIGAVVLASLYLGRVNWIRVQRIERLSGLVGRAKTPDILDPSSSTGYAQGQREMITPARNEGTFHWVEQTQRMFSTHEMRIRYVDSDNAPAGHEVNLPSPYRWFLGAFAWIDHKISGKPVGYGVERSTLYVDPLLQLMLLAGLSIVIARQLGSSAAILFSLGFAGLFPFAAEYFPGQADESGLVEGLVLIGLLLLTIGLRKNEEQPTVDGIGLGRRNSGYFVAAGIVQGLSAWIGLSTAIPILGGVFLGGLLVELRHRHEKKGSAENYPWRLWAWSGALTTFAAYIIEYFPAKNHLWNIEAIHPLYSLAWLGCGELLTQISKFSIERKNSRRWRLVVTSVIAAILILPVPVIMAKTSSRGFLGVPLAALRLSKLPESPIGENTWRWALQEGATLRVFMTLAPLILLGFGAFIIIRGRRNITGKLSLFFLTGPALIATGYAMRELSWWSFVDLVALCMTIAMSAEFSSRPFINRVFQTAFLLIVVGGAFCSWPTDVYKAGLKLTQSEAELLMERDLAHWLFRRAVDGPAVIFATPHQTATQIYYGGMRGIGTLGADNRVGLGATIAIASATTMEEAHALLEKHEVKFIVIPSWDPFFENYPRLYLDRRFAQWTPFFIPELRQWHLPLWLRPVPYDPIKIGGLEEHSVVILEMVDEQAPVLAASRLAEYFVEIGDLAEARAAENGLRRFPADIGALAARAQVASASDDQSKFNEIIGSIIPGVENGADRYLPWDRRVSLAIALARAESPLAPAEVKRCIDELTPQRARFLSTGLLYNLMVMAKTYEFPIADPSLRQQTSDLLQTQTLPTP